MATRDVTVRITTEMATVTEREAVLRERAAFIAGAKKAGELAQYGAPRWTGAEITAQVRYPLPKVTRPRMLVDESGMGWKFEHGFWYTLSARAGLIDWKRDDPSEVTHELTATRAKLWADLLTNPTEEVDA